MKRKKTTVRTVPATRELTEAESKKSSGGGGTWHTDWQDWSQWDSNMTSSSTGGWDDWGGSDWW
ncbi:MAG: hypothetical protein AAF721_36930 [Myxococcota bacterium]